MKIILYYNEQRIKKIRYNNNKTDIMSKILPINVYFKKHLFATNVAGIVVTPTKVKYTTEKEAHLDVKLVEGVNINE